MFLQCTPNAESNLLRMLAQSVMIKGRKKLKKDKKSKRKQRNGIRLISIPGEHHKFYKYKTNPLVYKIGISYFILYFDYIEDV